jgi:hypothetical protein
LFDTLINKLKNDTYITLETTPGHSPTFTPIIDKIEELELQNYVDGFSTTDNPLAKLKYNSLFAQKPKEIYPFAVVNSYAKNPKTLQKKMQKKIKHGALGIITQPVYDLENAKQLLELKEAANRESGSDNKSAELILGFFPITKLRTAQFLSAHVPGINVPDSWIEALRIANEKGVEEEYKVGFELSKNLFDELKEYHPKIHLMTANQFKLAKDILK